MQREPALQLGDMLRLLLGEGPGERPDLRILRRRQHAAVVGQAGAFGRQSDLKCLLAAYEGVGRPDGRRFGAFNVGPLEILRLELGNLAETRARARFAQVQPGLVRKATKQLRDFVIATGGHGVGELPEPQGGLLFELYRVGQERFDRFHHVFLSAQTAPGSRRRIPGRVRACVEFESV